MQQSARNAGSRRWMRLRALLVSSALLGCFGAVLARAAKVQLFDRARLSRLARDQTRREIEWAPRRGLITDRRGAPLAVTLDVDSVFADPSAFAGASAQRRPTPWPARCASTAASCSRSSAARSASSGCAVAPTRRLQRVSPRWASTASSW